MREHQDNDQQLHAIQTTLQELQKKVDALQSQDTRGQVNIINGAAHSSSQKTSVAAGGNVTGVVTQGGTGGFTKRFLKHNKHLVFYLLLIATIVYGHDLKESVTTLTDWALFGEPEEDDRWMDRYE